MEDIPIAEKLSIRECGLDEYWLQDQIFNNPTCLGLGELDAVDKERRQASGGRLDILLKNPEDDTMYEVEIMLGETDESHIIRTIEYWDNEKRKWPQRQHNAVLVAESITRRYFNVIQLLSHAIPVIAIQANIIEVNGIKSLNFVKVLDTYEEIDDGTSLSNETYDEAYWVIKAQRVIDFAKALQNIASDIVGKTTRGYTKHYISLGSSNLHYMWLHRRSGGKVSVGFRVTDSSIDEAIGLLDENDISYIHKRKTLRFTTSQAYLKENPELFTKILEIIKQYWKK